MATAHVQFLFFLNFVKAGFQFGGSMQVIGRIGRLVKGPSCPTGKGFQLQNKKSIETLRRETISVSIETGFCLLRLDAIISSSCNTECTRWFRCIGSKQSRVQFPWIQTARGCKRLRFGSRQEKIPGRFQSKGKFIALDGERICDTVEAAMSRSMSSLKMIQL